MNVWVSAHAADRFAERVRPGLDRRQASVELARLLREFGRRVERPAWVAEDALIRDDAQFVAVSDGVVVAVGPADARQSGRGWPVAVTVLVRGGEPREVHRGQGRRAQRRGARVAGKQGLGRRRLVLED